MTYSFPCTDLSKAGKQKGMSRESGTRSGLLWEVERLLKEMDELPQVLLMENVPDVIGDKFIADFADWIQFLDGLGYTSKYEILNAKDYGIPQNRDRCFMVSWLGEYYYDFPEPFPLRIRLKDVLEPVVDEKYYLSDAAIAKLILNTPPVFDDGEDVVTPVLSHIGTQIERYSDVSTTVMARDYKGFGNQGQSGIIVAGSLNPDKTVQDRVRVLSAEGICQGLRATDYKDPPKIVSDADGVYTNVSPSFTRPPLKGLSRSILADKHDAAVVLYEESNGESERT